MSSALGTIGLAYVVCFPLPSFDGYTGLIWLLFACFPSAPSAADAGGKGGSASESPGSDLDDSAPLRPTDSDPADTAGSDSPPTEPVWDDLRVAGPVPWGSADGLLDGVTDGRALHLVEADHCDFEHPTDWVCQLACGTESNDLFADEEIQATLLGLTTSFLLAATAVDPGALDWWTPGGAPYEALLAWGAIAEW